MTDWNDWQVNRTARMWRKLGKQFEEHAYAYSECGELNDTIRYAQAAEACYWQATGEGDFTSLSELTSENDSDN